MHVVLVTDVTACTKEGGDAEEYITSEWIKIEKIMPMIAEGKIVDLSILAGLAMYNAHTTV